MHSILAFSFAFGYGPNCYWLASVRSLSGETILASCSIGLRPSSLTRPRSIQVATVLVAPARRLLLVLTIKGREKNEASFSKRLTFFNLESNSNSHCNSDVNGFHGIISSHIHSTDQVGRPFVWFI